MKKSKFSKIIFLFLSLLIIFCPYKSPTSAMEYSQQQMIPEEILESPELMTQEQLNDLFGEDPYLGQTSYLQSPDGFIQRDK